MLRATSVTIGRKSGLITLCVEIVANVVTLLQALRLRLLRWHSFCFFRQSLRGIWPPASRRCRACHMLCKDRVIHFRVNRNRPAIHISMS